MAWKLSPRARKGAVAAMLAAGSLVAGVVGQANAEGMGFQVGVSNVPRPSWGTAPADQANCPRTITSGEVCPFSGRVWQALVKDDTVYFSGEFTEVAPTIALGGALDGTSGMPRPGFPQLDDGQVNVAVPDGEGGWFIGGSFSGVNDQDLPGVAHIRPDGSIDTAFKVAFPGIQQGPYTIHSMAVQGTFLYLGGEFSRFVGYGTDGNKAYFARVSKASGSLDTAFSPAPNGIVRSIGVAPDGSRTYFSGDFSTVRGAPAAGLAAVDGLGNPQPWAPNVGKVNTVAVSGDGGRVYLGSNAVSAVDPAGNVAWSAGANGAVKSVALSRNGGVVYAGGDFSSLGNEPHTRLAAIDAASGTVNTSWNPDAAGSVDAMSVSEDDTMVYVGGQFSKVRNSPRNNLAAVDAATGALTAWDPNATGAVNTLAASGALVYAGGDFENLGAQPRTKLAAVDLNNGNLLAWGPKVENLNADGTAAPTPPVVQSLSWAPDHNSMYLGGIFTNISGPDGRSIRRENLAQIDLAGNVIEAFNPGEPQGAVRSLTVYGSTLYAGGDFQSIRVSGSTQPGHPDLNCNGAPDCTPIGTKGTSAAWSRKGLVAAFDANTGALDRNFNQTPASTGPGLIGNSGKTCSGGTSTCGNGAVKAIAVSPDGQYVYIGGTFSDMGGQLGIASLHRSNGAFTPWQPSVPIPIFDLIVAPDGDIFTAAGGGGGKIHMFRQGGVCERPATAKEKGPESPCWQHVYDGDSTSVDVSNGAVYGGGHFDYVTDLGAERHHMAGFSQDGALAENFYPRLDTTEGVFNVTVVPGRMVVVGGNFNRVNPCASGNPQEKPCWRAQPGLALFPGDPG